MIDGLRAEGESLPLVLWAVGEEIACSRASPRPARWAQDANGLMRRLRIFAPTNAWRCRRCRACSPRSGRPPCSTRMKSTGSSRGLSVPGRLSDPWEEMTRLALRVAAAGADREGGTAACPFPAPDFARPLPLTPSPAAPAIS